MLLVGQAFLPALDAIGGAGILACLGWRYSVIQTASQENRSRPTGPDDRQECLPHHAGESWGSPILAGLARFESLTAGGRSTGSRQASAVAGMANAWARRQGSINLLSKAVRGGPCRV